VSRAGQGDDRSAKYSLDGFAARKPADRPLALGFTQSFPARLGNYLEKFGIMGVMGN
jgi:hypothetical protein